MENCCEAINISRLTWRGSVPDCFALLLSGYFLLFVYAEMSHVRKAN